MKKWIFAFIFCAIASCSKDNGGGQKKFLIPWLDVQTGKYSLQTVTLSTLSSPLELNGTAATVYYQNYLGAQGFSGKAAEPHLILSGDTYVPTDIQSALAVAVYAQMERLYFYDRAQGLDAQVAWPRKVGVDLNMLGPRGSVEHNNAHYFSESDTMAVVPFDTDQIDHAPGQPLLSMALNQGVIAHEHFHAHFQHEVLNALDHSVEKTISFIENLFYSASPPDLSQVPKDVAKPHTPEFINGFVIRGWNEGLADFYAGISLHLADFFSASIPVMGWVRNLSGRTGLLFKDDDPQAAGQCGVAQGDFTDVAYCHGTVLARTLYTLANSGVEKPEKFMVRVLSRLHNLPERINPVIKTEVLNFDEIFPVVLDDFPVNKTSCRALNAVIRPETERGSFPKCLSL